MTVNTKTTPRLSANEKHDSLIKLLNTINSNVNNLQDYCIKQFEEINNKIEKLENKALGIQSSNSSLNFVILDSSIQSKPRLFISLYVEPVEINLYLNFLRFLHK